MSRIGVIAVAVALCCVAASASEGYSSDDSVTVSPKCAASLLTSSAAIGGVAAYAFTPTMLCTAGFCHAGVAGGSFASWWQSTMPLVVKGSLFSSLFEQLTTLECN